ncbi:MAG: Ni/Fe hydrogenase subunit alpha [Deltaproteobacteria bacterium]|nr:Ni/Fe hydrogenase subunit alpha [Deltaproteobacteria bacterium]
MKQITIDPITRLEGHGKIDIFLDDDGEVRDACFQVPELRGFERFCQGRPVEELPRIVSKICGVCPQAHHLASGKAVDGVFGIDPKPVVKKLRELYYMAHYVHSHIAHFYALAAPDFVLGPGADPALRNVLGVVATVGLELGGEVLKHRHYGQHTQTLIGGSGPDPVWTLPGGVSKPLKKEDHAQVLAMGRSSVDFALLSLDIFRKVVLGNKGYVDLILSDLYGLVVHDMGLVDADDKVNFYDGQVRVTGPKGQEVDRYWPKDYMHHVGERVEAWSYLKFPYLRKVGWKGFVEGEGSGVYRATPLSRLNAAAGMATPRAQAAYEEMYKTLGGKPVHATLATHWARLVELLYAAERWVELAEDAEICDPDVRPALKPVAGEGVGCVEAPRGTLTHHYRTDSKGLVTDVNIIVGTTNNNAPISMSIAKAAKGVIRKGTELNEGILNMIEMAFRAYDPCFSCATHFLPGQAPLIVRLLDAEGEVVDQIKR